MTGLSQLEKGTLSQPSLPSSGVIPAGGGVFRYVRGQVLKLDVSDKRSGFLQSLRVKANKIEVWWEERGQKYASQGKRFLALTLTFRNEEAWKDFEEWGGRRRFVKELKRKEGGILDYVVVAEFQERGVIHYHYLLVVEKGHYIRFPDKVFYRWGYTNLRVLRKVREAKGYLTRYVRKLKQLSYEVWLKWKEKYGRFRLYDFGRAIGRGVLGLVQKGWGRVLYFRVLKGREGWYFRNRKLYVEGGDVLVGIKADWEFAWIERKLYLGFGGFKVSVSSEDGVFDFLVESLDDLVGGLTNLFEIKTFKEV